MYRLGANSGAPEGKHVMFHYWPRRVTIVTNLMSSHIAPFLITVFNMVSTVIITLTFVVAVYGHKCQDFKLSAADQSVIDMMEHYLHTSRKTENSDWKLGNTFYSVFWSKKNPKTCRFKIYSNVHLILFSTVIHWSYHHANGLSFSKVNILLFYLKRVSNFLYFSKHT